MRICVIGCAHGELDDLFAAVEETEARLVGDGRPGVDLVVCCGDFQACRNHADLETMACPPKYRSLNTFHEYYYGRKVAPKLTLLVGGNHEASNHMQELPYGGWVAPNMYYLGYAGCVRVGRELVVAGLSGIFNDRDVDKGRFERVPYTPQSMRTVFHVKHIDANRLLLLPPHKPIHVFLSHDWPLNATERVHDARVQRLLQRKPYFRREVEQGELGSPVCRDLLRALHPSYWFAAHLHVKFAQTIDARPSQATALASTTADPDEINLDDDDNNNHTPQTTKFLALDKIVRGRDFLQIVDIPSSSSLSSSSSSSSSSSAPPPPVALYYDADWLAIIKATHALTPTSVRADNWDYVQRGANIPAAQAFVRAKLGSPTENEGAAYRIPTNFECTANPAERGAPQFAKGNSQTDALFALLELEHRFTVPSAS